MQQTKQAKILTDDQATKILDHIKNSRRYPIRDTVIFLMSHSAGLRAMEISNLDWWMVLNSTGGIDDLLTLPGKASKGGYGGRSIPLSTGLKQALQDWHSYRLEHETDFGFTPIGKEPILVSERSDRLTPKAIGNLFADIYKDNGLQGCSSHSGRRTFATTIMINLTKAGGTIADAMRLTGHKEMRSFLRYIQPDNEAQKRLIEFLR